jgi:hypothetical protein
MPLVYSFEVQLNAKPIILIPFTFPNCPNKKMGQSSKNALIFDQEGEGRI